MSLEEKKKRRGLATFIKKDLKPKLIKASKEGRFLFTEIQKDEKTILIANIYAPNTHQAFFYKKLFQELRKLDYDCWCLIGDFNVVVDREMDKKYNKVQKKGKYPRTNCLPESFFFYADEFSLIDAWKTRNQRSKSFSHYSNRHDSW